MLIRIAVGVLMAALYIYLVFANNGLPFALFIATLSFIGAKEFYNAVKKQGGEPTEPLGLLACIIFQLAAWTCPPCCSCSSSGRSSPNWASAAPSPS